MQVTLERSKQRRASCSKTAVAGDTWVAPRPSDALLEALRPGAEAPASEDGLAGAVATMVTIVTTSGPPHQVRGERSGGRREGFFFSG
jgi:hypothetical protein